MRVVIVLLLLVAVPHSLQDMLRDVDQNDTISFEAKQRFVPSCLLASITPTAPLLDVTSKADIQ